MTRFLPSPPASARERRLLFLEAPPSEVEPRVEVAERSDRQPDRVDDADAGRRRAMDKTGDTVARVEETARQVRASIQAFVDRGGLAPRVTQRLAGGVPARPTSIDFERADATPGVRAFAQEAGRFFRETTEAENRWDEAAQAVATAIDALPPERRDEVLDPDTRQVSREFVVQAAGFDPYAVRRPPIEQLDMSFGPLSESDQALVLGEPGKPGVVAQLSEQMERHVGDRITATGNPKRLRIERGR